MTKRTNIQFWILLLSFIMVGSFNYFPLSFPKLDVLRHKMAQRPTQIFMSRRFDISTQRKIKDAYDPIAWKSGKLDTFEQTPLSAYWKVLPDMIFEEEVDVSTFRGLAGACKALLNLTDLVPVCGRDNLKNPFWMQAVLLDWLWRSGRFAQAPYRDDYDEGSWWACIGRALVLCPLVAAHNSALLECDNLVIKGFSKEDLQRLGPAIEEWRAFFYQEGKELIPPLIYNTTYAPEFARDGYLNEFWVAQSANLQIAMEVYLKQFQAMPPKEKLFALGWLRATNFIAESMTHIGLEWFMKHGTKFLPDTPVKSLDEEAQDLDPQSAFSRTKQLLRRLKLLALLPGSLFLLAKEIWRRAFSLDFMRIKGRQEKAIECLLHGNPFQALACGVKICVLALLPNIKYLAWTKFPLGSADEEFIFRSYLKKVNRFSANDMEDSLRGLLGDSEYDELYKEIQENIMKIEQEEKNQPSVEDNFGPFSSNSKKGKTKTNQKPQNQEISPVDDVKGINTEGFDNVEFC